MQNFRVFANNVVPALSFFMNLSRVALTALCGGRTVPNISKQRLCNEKIVPLKFYLLGTQQNSVLTAISMQFNLLVF